jgi:hypothetical protein
VCAHQGVKRPQHRAKLVALANDMLLFRSPGELNGARAARLTHPCRPWARSRCAGRTDPCVPCRCCERADRLHLLRQVLWLTAGIYDADVAAMVGRYPRVVCGDVAVSVSLKLTALTAGLPGVDMKRLLEAAPQLLSLEPHSTVIARAHALAVLLPKRDVLRMCELHPPLLTVCVRRTVAPALAGLRAALCAHGAADSCADHVAEAAPRLLTSTPATVAARMALLERVAPGTVAALAAKPHALARLLCSSERALMRIRYVRELAAAAQSPTPTHALGPVRVVGLTAAIFSARFPGFDAWYDAARAGDGTQA